MLGVRVPPALPDEDSEHGSEESMGSKTRYVVVGVLLTAVLLGVSLSHGLRWTFAQVGLDDMPLLSRELTLSTVLAYALSAVAALVVLKNQTVFSLATEVVDELSKVTWPTREETSSATVVVIVTVVVCSVYLGLFDSVWMWVTDLILGVPRATPG